MNQSSIELLSVRRAAGSLACFGPSHGYRFDGDTVHLRAMFTAMDPDAHQRSWALQLWACPQTPAADADLVGFLVAEAPLPPMGELVDERESFEVAAVACPPAGTTSHVMVLVLAAGVRGCFDEVHDLVAYPCRESFTQPRLAGRVGFAVNGDRVTLEVEHIENPRDAANVSGTLALELWALQAPYRGGPFAGAPLAGVLFGPISGGHESTLTSFDLPYAAPPAGCWHYVAMLREWTAAGFVTRDYSNFPVPVSIEANPQPVPTAAAPKVVAGKPAAKSTRKPAAKVAAKSVTPAATSSASKRISVNKASRAELESIKRLPAKVVERIVARRPFRSFEELANVKGMGAKQLAKVRSRLKL